MRPLPFGHLGDGNIHYNVAQPVDADKAEFLERWHDVNKVVFDVVLKYGGSISAEHGIGIMKRDLLPTIKDPVAMDLMRALKRTLDPNGDFESREGALILILRSRPKRRRLEGWRHIRSLGRPSLRGSTALRTSG